MKVIILAGGSGTRLWPLSSDLYPKQFIKLRNDKPSLFQETFIRSLLLSDISDIYIVTNKKYELLVQSNIAELDYSPHKVNIIVEPEAKNTLTAIYSAVYEISKNENDSIVVFPSDHIILNNSELVDSIKASVQLSKISLVTFGIKPTGANTGYGYISLGQKVLNGYRVDAFKEKPDYDTAIKYVNNGYYWNSGIFMFSADLFIMELRKHADFIFQAFESSSSIEQAYSKIEQCISIDYGLAEKSNNICVVLLDVGWNDLGSFDAFFDIFEKDEHGNITDFDNVIIDSGNNYIYSDKNKLVSLIGINDMIIVDKSDTLLICKRGHSQKVKEIINQLKSKNDRRLES